LGERLSLKILSHKNVKIDKHSSSRNAAFPTYTQQPKETYSEMVMFVPRAICGRSHAGAINLPVLDDAERAQVGTIYKQVCPFARKTGAALVAKNISNI